MKQFIPNVGKIASSAVLMSAVLVVCVALAGAAVPAFAVQSAPALVNYQGKLADANGQPLTGLHTLTFRVYDAVSGGNLVWGPQVFDGNAGTGHGSQVTLVGGAFNVILGPTDTDGDSVGTAFDAPDRYIELAVDNGTPISPRQRVLSAPFALVASKVPDGSIGSTALADGGIQTVDIANRAVTGSKMLFETYDVAIAVPWNANVTHLEDVWCNQGDAALSGSYACNDNTGILCNNFNVWVFSHIESGNQQGWRLLAFNSNSSGNLPVSISVRCLKLNN